MPLRTGQPFDPVFLQLVNALGKLPGVGRRGARRMANHLLLHSRDDAIDLGNVLLEASRKLGYCTRCRLFSGTTICDLCSGADRDQSILSVVASPADIDVLEAGGYDGLYFVLHGLLSPMRGITPEHIGINLLVERVAEGDINEMILALPATLEGGATAQLLIDHCSRSVHITRLAQGIPMGSELSALDEGTVAQALKARRTASP